MTVSNRTNDYEPVAKNRPARPFVDATPMLDIRKVLKAAQRTGSARVTWANDLGIGILEADIDVHFEHLDISLGRFDGLFEQNRLRYDREGGRESPLRVYFRCPRCDARRAILSHYRNKWGCRKCFGLVHRSQYITGYEKDVKELQELRSVVQKGRPKGVRHNTWNAKRERLHELQTTLASSAPRLSHNELSKKTVSVLYTPG